MISPISCWEVATLLRLGRIELDRPLGLWVARLVDDPRSAISPLSAAAAAWAGALGDGEFPGDPADRLIVATARELRVPLVSKDDRLRAFAATERDFDVVW